MIALTPSRFQIFCISTLALLTCSAMDSALAQFGRDRGGRGGDPSSPFSLVKQDDVKAELKLTDDQIGRIKDMEEEIRKAEADQPRPPFPEKEEERAAFSADMQKRAEERNTAALGKIKGLLDANQFERLQQVRLQKIGLRALASEQISTELKINDQQKAKLAELAAESQAQRFNFGARREEREKAAEELNAKFLAVLSSEQKKAWETKLGPPLQDPNAPAAPATSAAPANTPQTTTPPETYVPPVSDGPVVVSFDGTKEPEAEAEAEKAPAIARKASTPPPDKDKPIQFFLENAPWEMVLNKFAKKADLTLQILDLPPGSLTYTNDEGWYTPTEALDILHGYLLQKGYIMAQRDRFLVVLSPDKRPIPPNIIPYVTTGDLEAGKHGKHLLASVVLPLEGVDANEAAREVEALKGAYGTVAPLGISNALVVMDTFANLQRIYNLLKGVAPSDPEAQQFKSFPLKYMVSDEAAVIVRDQLGLPLSGTSSSNSSDRNRFSFSFPGSNNSSSRTSSFSPPAATAKVTPDPRTNSLLVTATKNQLAIAEQILTTIDIESEGMDGRPYLHVYHVKKADTDEVKRTLNVLMPGVVIGDDEDRTGGRLHVKATPHQHELVAEHIAKMDGTGGQSTLVIPLSLDPVAVAGTLNSMFSADGDSAPMILADSIGRRLMIRGNSEQLTEVRTFLDQLGENGTGTKPNLDRGPVRNYPLGGRNPEEFARILEQIWNGRSDSAPLRVVIPSNSPIQGLKIPSAMNRPGNLNLETPSTQRRPPLNPDDPKSTSTEKKPLFPVSLLEENVEPAQAETPQEAAEDDSPMPAVSTLRIAKSGEMTLNGEATPSLLQLSMRATRWKDSTPEADRKFILSIHPETPFQKFGPVLNSLKLLDIPYTMTMTTEGDAPAKSQPKNSSEAQAPKASTQSQSAPADTRPSVKTAAGKLPITMTVLGGDLRLIDPNGNGESLDEMEAIIEQLALAIPPRNAWTVYYLRSADVTETAAMLEQLFPSSSVSSSLTDDGSFFSGLKTSISSLSNGLVDAAGMTSLTQSPTVLKIIPELRSNSLFVSGPADQVQQVEQMLQVLDADDLPETLRDRVPRMIPVEHANVSEVAVIVKDVYKDLLEDPRQNQSRNNPLAAMMGGGGNSGSNRGGSGGAANAVRMTIGVDNQTNNLVVSASDSLFQQVKEMVADLDKAALDAHRTVQVVSVNEASSVVLQQALTALLPNVSVSTTSSGSGGSSSQQPQNPFGGGSSGSDDAERRARYESFMRSRSGGDSNSGRSTSGVSFPSFGGSSRGSSDSGRSSYGGFGSSRGGFPGFGGSRGGSDSGRSSYGGSSRGGSDRGSSSRGR